MKIKSRRRLEALPATAAKLYESKEEQTWTLGLIKYGRVTILNGMQKAVAQLSPALTSILAVCQKTDDRQRMKTRPESGGCKAQHAKHPRNLR